MSHEIRTPMTAILGYADLMSDPEQSQSDRWDSIQTIRRNGEHLLRIINDILDISKIEAGKLTVERIDCSPAQIVGDVASLMRGRAIEKGLEFAVEYVGPIPRIIQTDPTRLRQILMNLCGNAVKFTKSGGVRIVSRLVGSPTDEAPRLRFEVIDTGIGLNTEQVAKLFQPFTQADTSTTREYGGTGLGLTISKRLAQMLGGDISIQSAHGKGSSFIVEIETSSLEGVAMINPAQEAELVPTSTAPATPINTEVSLEGLRVLLAEDGPDNQRLISFHLRKAGAEATVAANGRIAVDEATAAIKAGKPFHVILMDMQMPELDGYGATARLRTEGYTLPIVALTANAMEGDRERCLKAGCDDFATKPIDRTKLLQTIAEFGERAKQQLEGNDGDQPPGSNSPPRRRASDNSDTAASQAYITELPQRIAQIELALRKSNIKAIERTAQQLGDTEALAAFEDIRRAASDVAIMINRGVAIDDLKNQVCELIDLCRQTVSRRSEGTPA
jgi:CheY-like chemotaxis protein